MVIEELRRRRVLRTLALLAFVTLLAACSGRTLKPDQMLPSVDVPASFDVVLLADEDGQFDYDGAPLTSEDLRSALRYRKEERLPVATVLLKRAPRQKVRDIHVSALGRIAHELDIQAFVEERDVITAIQVQTVAR